MSVMPAVPGVCARQRWRVRLSLFPPFSFLSPPPSSPSSASSHLQQQVSEPVAGSPSHWCWTARTEEGVRIEAWNECAVDELTISGEHPNRPPKVTARPSGVNCISKARWSIVSFGG